MNRLGMDVAVVESMGKQLKAQSRQVHSVITAVDGQINRAGSHWWGGHGRQFVSQWRTVHRPALLKLAEEVEGLGQSALNNVAEQQKASQASGQGTSSPTRAGRALPVAPGLTNHDRELKALASSAYLGAADQMPDGWEMVDTLDVGDGLSATLFSNGKGEYVLAYRGSVEQHDWMNDLYSHVATADQQMQAVQIALKLRQRLGPDAHLEFTGHSLGGALAAVSSLATGDRATTFNSAGVDPETARYALSHGAGPSLGDAFRDSFDKFVTRKIPVVSGWSESSFNQHLTESLEPGQIRAISMDSDPLSKLQDGTVRGLGGLGLSALEVPIGNVAGAIGERIIIHDNSPGAAGDNHSLASFDDPTNTPPQRGASGQW